MTYKFSGECSLVVTEGTKEFDGQIIIGEYRSISDDVSFDEIVQDYFAERDDYKTLADGVYQVYFTGTLTWDGSYNYEYGITEYDAIIEIDYVSFNAIQFFTDEKHRKAVLQRAETAAMNMLVAVKQARDNPYGEDNEAIAEAILAKLPK